MQRLCAAGRCVSGQIAAVRSAAAHAAPRTAAVALPGEWLGGCQLRQSSGALQLTAAAERRPSSVDRLVMALVSFVRVICRHWSFLRTATGMDPLLGRCAWVRVTDV